MALTALEQWLLERINAARLDPVGEAARQGIDLNEGLAPGTIRGAPMQVLAPDGRLDLSADRHSRWMLDNDVFSHTGAGGSSAGSRAAAAGFDLRGPWYVGENLSWTGSTGAINSRAATADHFDNLFHSPGHRIATLNPVYSEVGLGQVEGSFSVGGRTYNASMLTENFAHVAQNVHVTGVAYRDRDRDGNYDVGEGMGRVWISADGDRTTTSGAGGYGLQVNGKDMTEVRIGTGGQVLAGLVMDLSDGNGKLDLVMPGTKPMLALSVSAQLQTGINNARLLGVADLDLDGLRTNNTLVGNRGDNQLSGHEGHDRLIGGEGNDRLSGGGGNDQMTGGGGADTFVFQGGQDVILDMDIGTDRVVIDLAIAGAAGMSLQDVMGIARFDAGDAVLDFGNGDILTLKDVRNFAVLADDLILI